MVYLFLSFFILLNNANADDLKFLVEKLNLSKQEQIKIEKLLDPQNILNKKNSKLSKNAILIKQNILQEYLKNLQENEKFHGGFKLINWPNDSEIIDKYIHIFIQEERI